MISVIRPLFFFMLTLVVGCLVSGQKEDPRIVANIAAGEKVLGQYQALLKNSKISASIKNTLKDSLYTLKRKNLNSFVSRIGGSAKAAGPTARIAGIVTPTGSSCDRSCCKVILPPVTKSRQLKKTRSCTLYYTEKYNSKCGFLGLGRCGRSRTKQRSQTCYSQETQYYSVPQAQICPTGKDTCCEGAVYFDRCCISIVQMQRLIEKYVN